MSNYGRTRPLSAMTRVTFPIRGMCDVCYRRNVACRVSGDVPNTYPLMDRFVCADCTMTGRA